MAIDNERNELLIEIYVELVILGMLLGIPESENEILNL